MAETKMVAIEAEVEAVRRVKLLCWSNIAACHLKEGKPEEAMEYCDRVFAAASDADGERNK